MAHLILGEDKDVPGGQVSVDEALGLQVTHAISYLVCKVTQLVHGEAGPQSRLLQALQQRPQGGQLRHLEGQQVNAEVKVSQDHDHKRWDEIKVIHAQNKSPKPEQRIEKRYIVIQTALNL